MKQDFDIKSNNKEALDAIISNLTPVDWNHADFFYSQDINEIEMSSCRAYLLAVEYGKRIPDDVIRKYEATGGAVFNIHRADPQEYPGASVLNHQILNGESIVDVTLMRLRPGEPLDGGEIIQRYPVNIHNMLYPEIVKECRLRYIRAAREVIKYVKNGKRKEVPGPYVYKRRSPEDSELRLSEAEKRRIMAADNERFPAFFMLGGRKIILRAIPAEDQP